MEQFEGSIEEIIYYNPETGYTVGKFSVEGGERFTIVGSFPPLSAGEVLRISGKWEINPKYGKQFTVANFTPLLPATLRGIEKFLSSGLIKGIGPVLAKRIVRRFGLSSLDIISSAPERLKEVAGIGEIKLREIKKSWSEHRNIADLIIFLQEHNISTNLAIKIYRQYQENSFQVLKTNPYQACHDIWGIGFRTADQMALKLGFSPSSPERIKAFIKYLMEKDNEQGHVYSLQPLLEKDCQEELGIEVEEIRKIIEKMREEKLIMAEETEEGTALYLPFFYEAEREVAISIRRLTSLPCLAPGIDVERVIEEVENDLRINFSEMQKKAIKETLENRILIITGGPGTGKTTIIRAVLEIFKRWGKEVLLAAPTGRAAKRLSEATQHEARTIHRVLEYNPQLKSFRRNERRPLTAEVLIIDEFSMVDLPLMYHIFKALAPWMRLILVGDKDQLPSVGPGCLLRDMIESGRVEVVRLEEIFRQEKESLIVLNAHRVNQGLPIIYPQRGDKDSDFYFIHQEDEEKVFNTILTLCTYSIPRKFDVHPLSPLIQVISPMYKGLVGVDNLNSELQKRLNPRQEGLKFGDREIRLHDKVMQIKNNYEKEVFNGDIGIVTYIDRQAYRVLVDFDGHSVFYEKDELEEITLAYAISVHKSQGSEYLAVVMPLLPQHFIMLQRNLFYTALTRARKLSVIVGSYKALHIAIKNDKPVKRNCFIKQKLIKIQEKESFLS